MVRRSIVWVLVYALLATAVSTPATADSHLTGLTRNEIQQRIYSLSDHASGLRANLYSWREELRQLLDLRDRFADIDDWIVGPILIAAIDEEAQRARRVIAQTQGYLREASEERTRLERLLRDLDAESERLRREEARLATEREGPVGPSGIFEWRLDEGAPMPESLKLEPPFFASVTASSGHIDLDFTEPGPSGNLYSQVSFDIDFDPPPAIVAPGTHHDFDLTVTAAVVDPAEKGRGLRAAAYLTLNDRSLGVIAEAKASCVVNGGDADCEVVNSGPMPVSVEFPALSDSAQEGDSFSFGIGVANCGTCYVRYEYELTKP